MCHCRIEAETSSFRRLGHRFRMRCPTQGMLIATILLLNQHVIGQTGENCLQPLKHWKLREPLVKLCQYDIVNYTCLDMHVMCRACWAMGCPQHSICDSCGIFALNSAKHLGHWNNLYLIKVGKTRQCDSRGTEYVHNQTAVARVTCRVAPFLMTSL